MLPTLLGWAKRYLNRPFRWPLYCTEAIYAWYVLHQSLLIALLFWAKPLQLAPVLELLLLLAGTILGCGVLHELLIRRSRVLRPLFGLKSQPRQTESRDVRSVVPDAAQPVQSDSGQ
ncbi:hypothetical protein [Stenotrophomonas sp. NPDC077461]|uniref:hypothetical protein n=1 Tax=Stenotrophomonas sp. NPDC077461 TaxID=3414698 RepID=UPI003C2CA5FD